jgi:hypothetical protein
VSFDPPPDYPYPLPQGVPSSVTLRELRVLQEYARRARTVLEIGTHYGFSCIGMALAGAHVTSVDPHFEGPANEPDTWPRFCDNVRRHGLMLSERAGGNPAETPGWVDAYQAPIEELELESYWGMAFIDGNHTWPCPWRDALIARDHLEAPRYLAFHDVVPGWPGVYRAVLQLEAKGWVHELAREGTLRVYVMDRARSVVHGLEDHDPQRQDPAERPGQDQEPF